MIGGGEAVLRLDRPETVRMARGSHLLAQLGPQSEVPRIAFEIFHELRARYVPRILAGEPQVREARQLLDRDGHPALDQFFVEEFGGVLVSDFWAAYDAVGRTKQKCWPHLLRDLKEVDAGSDAAATGRPSPGGCGGSSATRCGWS